MERVPADGFLHVIMTGEETIENLKHAWNAVAELAHAFDPCRVLAEGYMEGPGKTNVLFDIGAVFPTLPFPSPIRIAVVCKESKFEDFRFAENVAVNRGAHFVAVFTDVNEAIAWLARPD